MSAHDLFGRADLTAARLLELRLSELGPMLLADRLAGLSSRELAVLADLFGQLSSRVADRYERPESLRRAADAARARLQP